MGCRSRLPQQLFFFPFLFEQSTERDTRGEGVIERAREREIESEDEGESESDTWWIAKVDTCLGRFDTCEVHEVK